ncbi:hypothetical protein A4D02_29685 [Niastella koreensis]|uniref:Uncharacterized protein n=2 Tax=Niastella koreensis TaxID=354356 RepID=G8TQT4_NIAKG|nr:DUF6580 family putative transport protein [Niastella koreensis]AEV96818.1 hypothetical protein Niako_0420 [Niastella koreensis GR20-10]OQP49168.1 hypothetical protein A4D02_29685 [Niastella koreensis]
MKINKSDLWVLVIMVVVAALYRAIPGRPAGFAPQLALAFFSGAILRDRKLLAFTLPLLSLFISNIIYQALHNAGLSSIWGIYPGMWIDYAAYASVTVFGFFMKKINVMNVLLTAFAAPTYFFLLSNFLTWTGLNGYNMYPKTFIGLLDAYAAGLPFYPYSVLSTVLFSGVLFGSWYFVNHRSLTPVVAA